MTFVIKKLRRSVNPVRVSVCRKTYKIFENGVWGVAPSGVRAAAPHSAPAWMPGVYAQGLCKDAKPTKHTQPFTGKMGLGIGIEDKHFFKKHTFPTNRNSDGALTRQSL